MHATLSPRLRAALMSVIGLGGGAATSDAMIVEAVRRLVRDARPAARFDALAARLSRLDDGIEATRRAFGFSRGGAAGVANAEELDNVMLRALGVSGVPAPPPTAPPVRLSRRAPPTAAERRAGEDEMLAAMGVRSRAAAGADEDAMLAAMRQRAPRAAIE